MGRRRKIFTKREYEKLSKTHEGRQTINKTYCGVAFLSLFGCLALAIFPLIVYPIPIVTAIGFIGAAISLIVAIYYIFAFRSEENEEQKRIAEREKNQKLIAEANTRRLREEQLAREQKAKEEQEKLLKFKNSNMDEIDKMNGYQFEEFVKAILSDLGYKAITTQKSGDFGVDVILRKGDEQIIVQTKRYAKKVSLSAVQEITSAKNYYDIQNAWVITNNYFTDPAKQLAKVNDVKLIDREELANLILKAKEARNLIQETA